MGQIVCRYWKAEEARWISHLDVKRTLERAMRRAELPLALTEGHNPHPKLSLGPPLSVGITGDAEMFAVHLEVAMSPEALRERLNAQLPPGVQVVEAWMVPAYRKKETFGEIDVAEYLVTVRGESAETLSARASELMARAELVVQRGGERPERSVDLRPLILSVSVVETRGEEIDLKMRLKTGSHGGARPQEVLSLLGITDGEHLVRYHRTGLYASGQESPQRPPAPPRRRWTQTRGRRAG
jgi:radical SAM-linked protein